MDCNTNNDFIVSDVPTDSISSLTWSPAQNVLASTSWDKTVRVWAVGCEGENVTATAVSSYSHEEPVLCCGFTRDGVRLISGGCDNKVKLKDLQAQQEMQIGQHDAPVRQLAVLDDLGLVVTGSWDKTLRFWSFQQATPVMTIPLPERVYAMDAKGSLLVVGCADRHILTYDLQQLQQTQAPLKQSFSALKMQTRCISCFPDKTGYAVGSVEGRCSITYLEDAAKNFTFKCHRQNDQVSAVNSIDFHPSLGTFSTAGGDGTFVFWDKENRQRLKQFSAVGCPITAGRFNATGDLFAYSVSYDWSAGHEPSSRDQPRQILLHQCKDVEVTPKSKK